MNQGVSSRGSMLGNLATEGKIESQDTPPVKAGVSPRI